MKRMIAALLILIPCAAWADDSPTPTDSPTATMTATPTATPTASPSSTPTVTPTATPYQTPSGSFWQEHFIGGTPGAQPAGWYDETDDGACNAHIAYSYAYSLGAVTRTAESVASGEVRSLTRTANVTAYPWIEIDVNTVTASASWALGVQRYGGDGVYYQIQGATTATGLKTYNYKTITGWSGLNTFAVVLTLRGAGGSCALVDSVRIMGTDNTPTMTVTTTSSPTMTASPTRTITKTITMTSTFTPTRTASPTPTMTPTRTYTRTASPTRTITKTITPTPIPRKVPAMPGAIRDLEW